MLPLTSSNAISRRLMHTPVDDLVGFVGMLFIWGRGDGSAVGFALIGEDGFVDGFVCSFVCLASARARARDRETRTNFIVDVDGRFGYVGLLWSDMSSSNVAVMSHMSSRSSRERFPPF
jgi:hypothetical protein